MGLFIEDPVFELLYLMRVFVWTSHDWLSVDHSSLDQVSWPDEVLVLHGHTPQVVLAKVDLVSHQVYLILLRLFFIVRENVLLDLLVALGLAQV